MLGGGGIDCAVGEEDEEEAGGREKRYLAQGEGGTGGHRDGISAGAQPSRAAMAAVCDLEAGSLAAWPLRGAACVIRFLT